VWDLAFAAFGGVPLHARHVVAQEGFTDWGSRSARLRLFLAKYGWTGTTCEFLDVSRARILAHADGVRRLAAAGDSLFTRLVVQGVADDLDTVLAELDTDHIALTAMTCICTAPIRRSVRRGRRSSRADRSICGTGATQVQDWIVYACT
jgi:hypothetical protein